MNAALWGCRIRCSHPDCPRYVDSWSDQGTPSLPFAGAPTEGPMKGWFLKYLNGVDYRPASWRRGHVAFCPEHSSEAIAWQATFHAWQNERHQVGKSVALPLLDRIAEWLSPSDKRRQINMSAYKATCEWEKSHPVPRPPWSRYVSVYS